MLGLDRQQAGEKFLANAGLIGKPVLVGREASGQVGAVDDAGETLVGGAENAHTQGTRHLFENADAHHIGRLPAAERLLLEGAQLVDPGIALTGF